MEDVRLPTAFCERYPPDRGALFDLIRALTTDEMLRVIAACDYGSDFDAHLEGLERIRAGVDLDVPIRWTPNEVLTLFRWGGFEDQRELKNRIAFHIARAFCAAALLRVPDENENRSLFASEALAPLVQSSLVLGEPFRRGLVRYLTWSLSALDLGWEPEDESIWDEDFLFHAFGLLVAIAHGPEADHAFLPVLEEWFLRANSEILPRIWSTSPNAQTFMDIPHHSVSPERWRALASTVEKKSIVGERFGRYLKLVQKRGFWGR